MKKRVFVCGFIVALFALATLIFFRHQIFLSIIDWQARTYCKECVGSSLKYSSMAYQDGAIVIDNPEVAISLDGTSRLAAEQLIIRHDWHIFKHQIDIDITISKPRVDINELSAELLQLLAQLRCSSLWIGTNVKLSVTNGVILLPAHSFVQIAGSQKIPIHFNVQGECRDALRIDLAGWLDEEESVNNRFEVHAKDTNSRIAITCNLHNMKGSDAIPMVHVLFPQTKFWEVTEGVVDGEMQFSFEKKRMQSGGELKFKQVGLTYLPINFKGKIPEATLRLGPEPGQFAHFEVNTPITLTVGTAEGPFTLLDKGIGWATIDDHNNIAFELVGDYDHGEKPAQLQLDGRVCPNTDAECHLTFKENALEKANGYLKWTSKSPNRVAEGNLKNIGPYEYNLSQALFTAYLIDFPKTQLKEGTIDLSFHTNLVEGSPIDLRVTHFKGKDVSLLCPSVHLDLKSKDLEGNFVINAFTPTFYDKIDAAIQLHDGEFTWTDKLQQPWHWDDVQAEVNMCQGTLCQSHLHLGKGPLIGDIIVDDSKELKLEVTGNIDELAKAIPSLFQEGVSIQFAGDKLVLKANAEQKDGKLLLKGILDLQGKNALHAIAFNFDWDPADSSVHNGRFRMENLALEKFVSPFIFPEEETTLSGLADIEGVFDSKFATINYTTRNLVAESPYFKIDIKTQSPEGIPIKACHEFNFEKGTHVGMIPIVDGSYHDKIRGMLFSNVKAFVTLQGKKALIRDIEAFANGVYLAGVIDVDYEGFSSGRLDMDMRVHAMNGKMAQLQQLSASYGNPLLFAKLPLDGNVSFIKEGGWIHLTFDPQINQEGYQVQSRIQGALTDGSVTIADSDVSIQDLCFNFDYNHQKNDLSFGEIQGSLLVGPPGYVEEYSIASDGIRFIDYSRNLLEFDLWIGDRKRDILRIAGKTLAASSTDPDNIAFVFDYGLTHFGDVHPNQIGLVINKDWSGVNNFQIGMEFRLNTLFRDLQRFSRSGLFFLSRYLLKELNDVKTASGDIKIDLKYDKQGAQIVYNLTGDDVVVNRAAFKKISLNGKKQDSTWIIDQLQVDDLSFSADITRLADNWKINFLGFRHGKALLLGLDGIFNSQNSTLDAGLNLVEINLSHLHQLPYLKSLVDQIDLKGELRGAGTLHLDFFKGNKWWRAESDIELASKSIEVQGIVVKDVEHIKGHYDSDHGISIDALNTALMPSVTSKDLVMLGLDKASYDFVNSEWQIKGMRFGAPITALTWLSTSLKQILAGNPAESVVDILPKIKREQYLDGIFNLEMSPVHHTFDLVLRGGKYFWGDQEHELTDIMIQGDSHEIKLATRYRLPQQYLWISARATPETQTGEIIIADKNPEEIHTHEPLPLVLHWQYLPAGLHIHTAEGFLAGLDIHLASNRPLGPLEGIVFVNMPLAAPLMSSDMALMMQTMGIGDGYALKGSWRLGLSDEEDTAFEGTLVGKNFDFKGYRLEALKADVLYSQGRADIKNMTIKDAAAQIEIPEMVFWQQPKGDPQSPWLFTIPQINVHDFQPSLLRYDALHPVKEIQKPLLIREIKINGISGNAFDLSTLSGTGEFHFTTVTRKNFPHPIFAIPSEVIGRLGLDVGVLNPFSGSVYYEIRGDKVYLTKLKDVYSEGKLSKFYLTRTPYTSYFDLNGNLNVQVKMKQYNLLFKLAELFTLTIQGNFQKPLYSLQKQSAINEKSDVAED